MIIFGTRGKALPGPRKQGIVCANCGKEEHATFGVLRYFHVFWIPVFPTMKQAMIECLHCRKVLIGKEVPERARRDVAEKVFTRGHVLPLYTGLAAAALFAVFVSIGAAEESRSESGYLAAPAVGDLYVVRVGRFSEGSDPRFPYGVVRVSAVSGERVTLQLGRYGYDRGTGAEKAIRGGQIGAPDYFAAEAVTVPMHQLQPMKSQGAIYSVKRR